MAENGRCGALVCSERELIIHMETCLGQKLPFEFNRLGAAQP
jgi:hypothetical protein